MAHPQVAAVSRPTSFYYAFLALSRRQREAIVAVWDFCRAVDDTVDEPQGPGARGQEPEATAPANTAAIRARLNQWRAEIDRCYGGTPETMVGRALQPWIAAFELTPTPFIDLVDGVEMDLDRQRYETFDALYEYCWRVASTVGLICLDIFGVRDQGRDYAMNLGVALQLTNILRDVATDFARGRIYLPQEDLARFGCSEQSLGGGTVTAPIRDLLAFEAARAHAFYARAARSRPAGAERRLVAAEIMTAIYRQLLASIEDRHYDVFSARVAVPRPRQARIAMATWVRVQLGVNARA
jgi:phytoene synthase